MIQSFLDQDLYKIKMHRFVCEYWPNARVRYKLFNRGETQFPDGFGDLLKGHIKDLRDISHDVSTIKNLCPDLDNLHVLFLEKFQIDPLYVHICQKGPNLSVFVEGPYHEVIFYEVWLMATISELYYKMMDSRKHSEILDVVERRTIEKCNAFNALGIRFIDFGTRRRYSYAVHDLVVRTCQEYSGDNFLGTSNLHLADKYKLKCYGTIAHELYQAASAITVLENVNEHVSTDWQDLFGEYPTHLTDTFTTDFCLKTNKYILGNSFRQDSGDPIEFIKKIAKYRYLDDINIFFTDSLNSIAKIQRIQDYCKKIGFDNDFYGIGTWLTNDTGVDPLNIVVKLVEIAPDGDQYVKVCKLSDDEGKHTGDEKTIQETLQYIADYKR